MWARPRLNVGVGHHMAITKNKVMKAGAWMAAIFIINNIYMGLFARLFGLGDSADEWPRWLYLYGQASLVLLPGIAVLWLGSLGHALKRLGNKNRNYGWWTLAQLFFPVIMSFVYYFFVYIKEVESAQQTT